MKYAGFWRRLGAHVIDSILLFGVEWLLELIFFGAVYSVYWLLARENGTPLKPFADAFDPFLTQIVEAVISIGILAGYYVWGQFRYGSTLGKKLLHIRVVRLNGNPVSLGQCWARFFGYLPSYGLLGCGFFMVAFHPHKRGLHDLIAGTVSVITE